MPDQDKKLKRLRRLENIGNPALFKEIEDLEAADEKLEQAQNALKNDLDRHMEQVLDEKLFKEQFQALQANLETKVESIELTPGPKGENYILTPKDKKEIASKIKVPVVEKIVEKTEVIREQPIVTNEIKEVAVTDTPEVIRDKIMEVKLPISVIDGLESKLVELKQNSARKMSLGGFNKNSMDFHIIDDETPSGTVNGTNQIFTLANVPVPTNSLKVFVNGQRLRITEDYTLSGGTITFNTAPPTTSVILCDYRI